MVISKDGCFFLVELSYVGRRETVRYFLSKIKIICGCQRPKRVLRMVLGVGSALLVQHVKQN
jgi:hypothetical protein